MIEKKEDTPTPSFPMEKDTDKYIRNLINESFNKSLGINTTIPQEEANNTMGVGLGSVNKLITFYWRPNNYRIQIPFNRDTFNLGVETTLLSEIRKGSVLKTEFGKVKVSNYGTKINFELDGLPVMIDKKSLTITFSLRSAISQTKSEKAVYKIEANNINEIDQRINEKKEAIKEKCLDIAKKVVKQYGGKLDLDKAIWIRHEDAIHKEDWIPDESIIYDTHFKKVYPDQVELKSPTFVKNFYSNRVIEEIAPQIAKELSEGNKSLKDLENTIVGALNPVLNDFTAQLRLHLEVQTETKNTLKEMRKPFFVRWYNYFKNGKHT
jgi:hypothetical protein